MCRIKANLFLCHWSLAPPSSWVKRICKSSILPKSDGQTAEKFVCVCSHLRVDFSSAVRNRNNPHIVVWEIKDSLKFLSWLNFHAYMGFQVVSFWLFKSVVAIAFSYVLQR